MASTPSNRLRPSASHNSLFQASTKSPGRSRTYEPRLSLNRVIGTTCTGPTAFDTAGRCFAYVAGGTVVVVDLDGSEHTQRFYRARPTANPVFQVAPASQSSNSPSNITPKANDARNRVARGPREPLYPSPDSGDSASSKTWTCRERIKVATCVAMSRDGRYLAVGETGYAPRVLIFGLKDGSSDIPLVAISEHGFGVKAVAWSADGKFLASLGTANDGFLFIWKIDPRNGSARLFQQSRCTTQIAGMVWMGSNLITFGTRYVRSWKVVDDSLRPPSPKKKVGADTTFSTPQKTLSGRNVILGSLLDTNFTAGLALDESNALLCSEGGEICLLDNTSGQLQLTQVAALDYGITCCSRYGPTAYIGGRDGQLARLIIRDLTDSAIDVVTAEEQGLGVLSAMGFVQDHLVTLDSDRSIKVWKAGVLPTPSSQDTSLLTMPGQNEPVLGVQSLASAEKSRPTFFTWAASGRILLWNSTCAVQESFEITVDDVFTGNSNERNQLSLVASDGSGTIFAAGDKAGVLRVVDYATGKLLMDTKAHTSDFTHIAVQQHASKTYIATSGRDRTVQLFHRLASGPFELLQTLEFPARVTHLLLSSDGKIITSSLDRTVQVHELVSKEKEPDITAAIHCRSIMLKTTPIAMTLSSDCKSLFVSTADKSVSHIDIESGEPLRTFKCLDENGSDTAVLESLVLVPGQQDEPSLLLATSNTDKSVRVYNANTGAFMDREWGHSEPINGLTLVRGSQEAKKVISVACDGTIFVWDLFLRDPPPEATSGSTSPPKDTFLSSNRQPTRRVLSKAEIAEFPRPSSTHNGRRSPPRTLHPRKPRKTLSTSSTVSAVSAKTPTATTFEFYDDQAIVTPSRHASWNISSSPTSTNSSPPSASRLKHRPSMPALGSSSIPPSTTTAAQARKKSSAVNLRGDYGSGSSLQAASEQTCRQLRAFRDKLAAPGESITSAALAELDTALRLTGAAVAERLSRSRFGLTEPVLSGLLDQYSERLSAMLDEKLRQRFGARMDGQEEGESEVRSAEKLAVEDEVASVPLDATGDEEEKRPSTTHVARLP